MFQWTSGPAPQVTPTVRLGASATALTQTYTNATAGVKTSIQTYTRSDMLGPRANSYGYFFPGAQPQYLIDPFGEPGGALSSEQSRAMHSLNAQAMSVQAMRACHAWRPGACSMRCRLQRAAAELPASRGLLAADMARRARLNSLSGNIIAMPACACRRFLCGHRP